jgi:anti-sigma B factor antagonist
MTTGTTSAPRAAAVRHPDPEVTVPPGLLGVAVSEPRPGVVVVSAFGEVDVSTAGVLRTALQDALAVAPRGVVVELSGVTFCGSTGLVVLMDAGRSAEAAGVRFGTAAGTPIVRRVLEITKLGPVLGHRDTLDETLRALEG